MTDEARLRDDFGADWLDRFELLIAIEDQLVGLEIEGVMVEQIDTVGDLVRIIEGVRRATTSAMMSGIARRWTYFTRLEVNVRKSPGAV